MSWFHEEDKGVAGDSLSFWSTEEQELRRQYEKAKADRNNLTAHPPAHFNNFQLCLAFQQVDEEINELSARLLLAEQKLNWEQTKRWKT